MILLVSIILAALGQPDKQAALSICAVCAVRLPAFVDLLLIVLVVILLLGGGGSYYYTSRPGYEGPAFGGVAWVLLLVLVVIVVVRLVGVI